MALELSTARRRFVDAVGRHRIYRDALEIGLVAIAFLLYFIVRGSVVDREAEAVGNAVDIINLEKDLGFFWEPDLNAAIQGYDVLIQFFNAIYFWLDFPLIVAIGLWLYFFGRRHHYTVARDALLASGAIALVCYHLYPVAPPRLLPPQFAGDFVDTVNRYSNFSYQAQSMQPFVNPYAAVPSLHYGWALLVGGVLFWSTRNVWLRAFALLMPAGQFAAILFTANHYIIDAFAGLVVAVLGLAIAFALQRWAYPRLQALAADATRGREPLVAKARR